MNISNNKKMWIFWWALGAKADPYETTRSEIWNNLEENIEEIAHDMTSWNVVWDYRIKNPWPHEFSLTTSQPSKVRLEIWKIHNCETCLRLLVFWKMYLESIGYLILIYRTCWWHTLLSQSPLLSSTVWGDVRWFADARLGFVEDTTRAAGGCQGGGRWILIIRVALVIYLR